MGSGGGGALISATTNWVVLRLGLSGGSMSGFLLDLSVIPIFLAPRIGHF